MQSRSPAILITLLCAVAFARTPRRKHLPVGLLYYQGDGNVANELERNLLISRFPNSNYTFRVVKERYANEINVEEKVCNLLDRGEMAIVATTPPSPTAIVYEKLAKMSNTYHIPLITYSMPEFDAKKPPGFTVTLKPSTSRAVLDLLQFYDWKNVIYIKSKDNDFGTFDIELASYFLPYNFIIDYLLNINTEHEAVSSLMSIQANATYMSDKKELNVVMNTPDLSKEIVFSCAKQRINKMIHFIIVEPFIDRSWADKLNHSKIKVTAINLVKPGKNTRFLRNKRLSVTDTLLSAEAGMILTIAYQRMYHTTPDILNYSVQKRKYSPSECSISGSVPLIHGLQISLAIKKKVRIEGVTGNLEFDIHGRRKNYVLHIVEITWDGNTEIGTWSDRTGLKMHLRRMFYSLSHLSLNMPVKETYTIVSILAKPYLVKHGNTYVGFCKDLIDLLSARLKFNYDLKLVEDGSFGSYDNHTDNWNGIIGEILHMKADMAVAPLTMTSMRSLAVEFTAPFQNVGLTLLLKNSNEHGSFCYLIFCPFSWQLWIFIIAVYVVFGVLYILMYRCTVSPKHQGGYKTDASLSNVRFWPLRIVLLVCLVFTIMIISMYIASLETILHQEASWHNTKRFDVKDVFKKSVLTGTPKLLLLRNGSTMAFFQSSEDPLYRTYWNRVTGDRTHFVTSYEEGVNRVLESNGDVALIVESAAGEYLANENCNLKITSGVLNMRSYGIAVRTYHPLRLALNEAILELRENEELDRLYDKWWKTKCTSNHDDSINENHSGRPLELMEMGGLFYMLTAGFGFIVLTTAIQLFFYQKRKASVQNDSSTSLLYK